MQSLKPITLARTAFWWKRWGVFYLAVLISTDVHTCHGYQDFKIIELSMDWMDALAYCKNNGYDGLAVLDSKEKLDGIKTLDKFKQYQDYWVGLQQRDKDEQKTSTYKWDFAMATTWISWNDDMPDLTSNNFCGFLESFTDGISSSPCTENFYPICEQTYNEPNVMTTFKEPAVQTTTNPFKVIKDSMLVTSLVKPMGPTDTQPRGSIVAGFFPIIHVDKNLANSYPDLVLFSGAARSDVECVTICAKEPMCAYTIFRKDRLHCKTYTSKLADESYTFVAEIGTIIREKPLVSGSGEEFEISALPGFPVFKTDDLDTDAMGRK